MFLYTSREIVAEVGSEKHTQFVARTPSGIQLSTLSLYSDTSSVVRGPNFFVRVVLDPTGDYLLTLRIPLPNLQGALEYGNLIYAINLTPGTPWRLVIGNERISAPPSNQESTFKTSSAALSVEVRLQVDDVDYIAKYSFDFFLSSSSGSYRLARRDDGILLALRGQSVRYT